jgi:hypothetical protein
VPALIKTDLAAQRLHRILFLVPGGIKPPLDRREAKLNPLPGDGQPGRAHRKETTLGAVPSYATVLRFMKVRALIKRPRRGPVHSPGARATEHRIEAREIRSYESAYVNALWHLDFHHGSLRVLLAKGRWLYPLMLGIIDDHSRLCCHAQW